MSTQVKEDGPEETKVETVDYRRQAGQEEPTKEKIGVIHLKRDPKKHESKSGGGILAGGTAAVTNTMKSAKEAIVGKSEDSSTPPK